MLDLPLEEIPDFSLVEPLDGEHFWPAVNEFLATKNLMLRQISEALSPPGAFYLVAGMSPRGFLHQVIYCNGQLAHDPHPSRTGILTEEYVEILVPLEPVQSNENL
jgi:hypothetical protein